MNAQNNVVLKGKVTTDQGEPIYGASIFVKSLSIGVTSDIDGIFLLEGIKTNNTYVVQVTYMGYNTLTKEVKIASTETIQNFILKESSYMLEGVVVTSQKREQICFRLFQTV